MGLLEVPLSFAVSFVLSFPEIRQWDGIHCRTSSVCVGSILKLPFILLMMLSCLGRTEKWVPGFTLWETKKCRFAHGLMC